MVDHIFEQMAQELELTPEELTITKEFIEIKKYPKGHLLLKAGELNLKSYFCLQGLVRKYYITDQGHDKTTFFFAEEQSIPSTSNERQKVASDYYLECLEESILLSIHVEDEPTLYKKLPRLEYMCRTTVEGDYSNQQEILSAFITKSPEERYKYLLEKHPHLFNRVPQYHLATYMGVAPETLSRIRKRIAQKA